ncbi:general secretion pathway protein K [Breoghania corrubedonensis]|uniref:General secretion pathway protein K n=1 Tax=Breoghania corrubedonensis TaxID=665038 RepID=A0A2T5VBC3_9HYPH|nr:type II secretion system protein GspK [Breoghania corrubedonensis]PTW61049.1 general secretion pathway protein K [Breoghania corrubedonensis]
MLASILAGFASVVQNRTARIAREVHAAAGARAADGGIGIAVAALLAGAAEAEDTPGRNAQDGTPFSCRFAEGIMLVITMQDVAGRLDLNTASRELLLAVLDGAMKPDAASRLIAAIMSRRNDDQFRTVEELAQLPGVDRALYERLRSGLTVHSGRAALDKRSTPPDLRGQLARAGIADDIAYASSPDGRKFAVSVLARTGPGRGYLIETTIEIRPGRMPVYRALSWNGHIVRADNATSPYAEWLSEPRRTRDQSPCTST